MTRVPKSAQAFVAPMVRTIFAQPEADTVSEQHIRIVASSRGRFPEAAALLEEGGARRSSPPPPSRKSTGASLWSNNSLERLNKEIPPHRSRRHLLRIASSIIRLVGALLAEQNDEWAVCRRDMSAESIAKALTDPFTTSRR